MTRICGILTVAVGLAIGGCATDNMAWNNDNDMGHKTASYDSTNMNNGQAMGQHDMNQDMNNTAQLGSGNDKNTVSVSVSDSDHRFINDASAANMYEINAGQRALMKANDTKVKTLAQHMVDDHTKAGDQLKALASRKGVRVTAGLSADQDTMIAQLDKLNGTDFDQEYLRQQRVAHEDTIAKFQTAANTANDKDVRDWAATTLPTLREHLTMINNQINPNAVNNMNVGSDK